MNVFFVLLLVNFSPCIISKSVIPWPPKSINISQYVDHFTSMHHRFNQTVLFEDKFWKGSGPILFYCGKKRKIINVWNDTGFIFEYARETNGFVIFAEHRYYGISLPYGQKSFEMPYIQYLSISQTLADYAYILKNAFHIFGISSTNPTFAFGGGYGGILAGLMRIKYPTYVAGALVSSAPFKFLADGGDIRKLYLSLTNIYKNCAKRIGKAYTIIHAANQREYDDISMSMKLCEDLHSSNDALQLVKWSLNAFVAIAMKNYPYVSGRKRLFPANPVHVSCNEISDTTSSAIVALRNGVAVYYNATGTKKSCYHYYQEFKPCSDIMGCGFGNNAEARSYQACTEYILYDSGLPLSFHNLTEYCQKKWSVKPNNNTFSQFYSDAAFRNASNIIFSNGDIDPWKHGGILQNISDSLVAFIINDGAHAYDLRESHNKDTSGVKNVRRLERSILNKWIKNFKKQ